MKQPLDEMSALRVFGVSFERIARQRIWSVRVGERSAYVRYWPRYGFFRWQFLGKYGSDASPLAVARAIEDEARDVYYTLAGIVVQKQRKAKRR